MDSFNLEKKSRTLTVFKARADGLDKKLVRQSQIEQSAIGPLHDPVTWYQVTHAGTQAAQWDFQNKATRTSPL